VFVDAGGHQLLHAELHLALFGVDGQHLRFDHLPGAQHIGGMIEAAFDSDLADVDEALNPFADLHECAEVHELCDWPLDLRTDRIAAHDFCPWIGERLFQTERDAPLFRLDRENDGIDNLSLFDDIAGDAHFLAPRHLGDMNQPFDPGLDLDESTELRHARDPSTDTLARLIPFR